MSKTTKFKLPSTTSGIRQSAVPVQGQLFYDKTEAKLYFGDGITQGGLPVGAGDMEDVQAYIDLTFNEQDYTSFRVYADATDDHEQTYAVGQQCPQFVPQNILFTGATEKQRPEALNTLLEQNPQATTEQIRAVLGTVQYAIPKSMTERFVLLSAVPLTENDIIVDWGDGTQSAAKNGQTKTARGNGYYDSGVADSSSTGGTSDDSHYFNVMFSHTYQAEGSYLIKIYGNDYVGIRHYYGGLNEGRPVEQQYPSTDVRRYNLMYECFGHDTHIASCVRNLASFSNGGLRMFHVLFNEANHFTRKQVGNWSSCFGGSQNLVSAREFYFGGYEVTGNQTLAGFFSGDTNLEIFSGRLPTYCTAKNFFTNFFYNCSKLRINIEDIIPSASFGNKIINVAGAFYNCASITGTVPAEHFWNDFRVKWENTSTCFAGCSTQILAQVPPTWGGTGAVAPDPTPVTVSSVVDIVGANVDSQLPILVSTAVSTEINKLVQDGTITNTSSEGSAMKFGKGNLLGGYGAVVEEYINDSTGTTPYRMKLRNDTEMERFRVSAVITINECQEDTDSTPEESPDDNDGLVWGQFRTAAISSVDDSNFYLYFSEDLNLQGDVQHGQVVIHVIDNSRQDAAISMGDRNFVTGDAAFATGLLNTAAGTSAVVVGSHNTVSGDFSAIYGVGSIIEGNQSYSFGGSNILSADSAMSIGTGNQITETGQGSIVLGCTNKGVSGIDAIVVGNGNSNVQGNRSVTIGFNLDNNLQQAIAIGASVTDSPQYKGSVNFPGLVFLKHRKELNADYVEADDPEGTGIDTNLNHKYVASQDRIKRGYYQGSLRPYTATVSVAGDMQVQLDPQQYSRYRLQGQGSLYLSLSEYSEDGDMLEIAFNPSQVSIQIPDTWVGQTLSLTGKTTVLIQVAKVLNAIFYCVKYQV